ncbi:NAD(P)H-dependent oxidoreductase [Actinoplanes sp. LDG1-06]|uniref:NAD(P)H-dependent oxidoreductase n=1 Tax=Paractinoplanes ovalisporus TaxID=2810368 RepID=A0ABS2APY4_9ACTN|nr:NAD(P)H-dependent oxidoreductase [Actinoplanes ovalisporus]MBM2621875.1 NAD(P)H-dependent oxidoreductase [Actinoplanes ovalisporus]
MTRILLISGSTREDSLQTAALRTAARFAPEDINAGLFEGLRGVPAFVPGEEHPHDTVVLLRHQVRIADAVLISTPEYAGTLPGALKNLLDWLIEDNLLDGKPVAWLSVSGEGEDHGARATLETVLSHTNAKVLRAACIRVPIDPHAVDRSGLVTDFRLHQALQDALQALVRVLAMSEAPPRPAWQQYSSVFPVIERRDTSSLPDWQAG